MDPLSHKSYTNYELNFDAKEGSEYLYVSQSTWREFHSHFGGMEVKRLINSLDDEGLKFQVENHLKQIRFILSNNQEQTHHLQMNRNETVKDL